VRHHDDDTGVKPRRHLSDRTADRLLRGKTVPEQPALTDFVAGLSALVPDTLPAPSERLAALLEQGPPVTINALIPQIGVRRPAHRLRRLSLATTAFLGLLLAAASVNTLPNPAQQVVSDVVGWVTPLHLPSPHEHGPTTEPTPHRHAPTATPSASAPGARPTHTPAASTPPTTEPDATPSPESTEPTDEPTDEPTETPTDQPTDEPTDGSSQPSGAFGLHSVAVSTQ